jgi:hypothetical protein
MIITKTYEDNSTNNYFFLKLFEKENGFLKLNYNLRNRLIGNHAESIVRWYVKSSFVLYNHNDLLLYNNHSKLKFTLSPCV